MNWAGLSILVGVIGIALASPPWGFLLVAFIIGGLYLWSKKKP